MKCLEDKTRPHPVDKLAAIKIVIDEIIWYKKSAGRRAFRVISNRIIAHSPQSFTTQVGSGADALCRMLENAYYNHRLVRQNAKTNLRQKLDQCNTSKRKGKTGYLKDSYGCVDWQPAKYPEGETKESQEEKRKTLMDLYQKESSNTKQIESLMENTYTAQRFFINQKPVNPISDIKDEWPFLFITSHFAAHFYKLTGSSKAIFQKNLEKKCPALIEFFTLQTSKHHTNWLQKVSQANHQTQSELAAACGAFCMLPSYFSEQEDVIFQEVEVRVV